MLCKRNRKILKTALKVKDRKQEHKTYIKKNNKISYSLHNFHLDAIKHRGQTETSAKILKTALKTDKVCP